MRSAASVSSSLPSSLSSSSSQVSAAAIRNQTAVVATTQAASQSSISASSSISDGKMIILHYVVVNCNNNFARTKKNIYIYYLLIKLDKVFVYLCNICVQLCLQSHCNSKMYFLKNVAFLKLCSSILVTIFETAQHHFSCNLFSLLVTRKSCNSKITRCWKGSGTVSTKM